MQAKAEGKKWLRSKREEAYANILRFLLKTLNRRSDLTADGMAYLGRDGVKEWFDDIVEAQLWANYLTIYCSESQKDNIAKVASDLNAVVSKFLVSDAEMPIGRSGDPMEATVESPSDSVWLPPPGLAELPAVVSSSYETVLLCAREDIGLAHKR